MRAFFQNGFVRWALLPVVVVWAHFEAFYPNIYYHYKLTIEVQTPTGVKSGSVVNEQVSEFNLVGKEFLPSGGDGTSRGEALFIDLGNGKNLVATLFVDPTTPDGLPHSQDMLFKSFCVDGASPSSCRNSAPEFRKFLQRARNHGPFEVDIRTLPELLTLTDINDYKSMQRIYPLEVDRVLGPGYAIKRVSEELTEEPLTHRIEQQLPWLASRAKGQGAFDGSHFSGPKSPILSSVGYKSFKRGS